MATYGTQKVLGGTRYKRYFDPKVKNTANEFGLYQWSTFRAYYAVRSEETGVVGPTPAPGPLTLLFLSDFPALARVGLTVPGTLAPVEYGLVQNVLVSGLKDTPTGSTVTLESFGQVAAGYTQGNSVYCTAFPVLADYPTNEGDPAQCFIEVSANSPVICSPIGGNQNFPNGFGFAGTPVGKGVSPIILQDTAYTEAIKKNDNVIVSTDGFEDVAYVVVGLWYTPGKG